MKGAVAAGRGVSAQKNIRAGSRQASLRERVVFSDVTDCLLFAYDGVARLAYEKFVVWRGTNSKIGWTQRVSY
jgi:hypothetical protein